MAKLKIDLKNLDNVIIPSITKTISHLNTALEYIETAVILRESDVTLYSSKSDIQSVKNNLNTLKDWCSTSSRLYKKLEEKYIGEATLLPSSIIPLRKNKIKE